MRSDLLRWSYATFARAEASRQAAHRTEPSDKTPHILRSKNVSPLAARCGVWRGFAIVLFRHGSWIDRPRKTPFKVQIAPSQRCPVQGRLAQRLAPLPRKAGYLS